MKYREWLDLWLSLYVRPTVKLRTYEKYGQIVRTRILPALGDHNLSRLTAVVLQRFVLRLSERLAPNTVNHTVAILRKSLQTAVDAGACKRQFSDGIRRPKTAEKRIECFTFAEQKKIEGCVRTKPARFFGIVLCLYTGLRIGELLALEGRTFRKAAPCASADPATTERTNKVPTAA